MIYILFASLLAFRVGAEVVVLFGKSEAALVRVGDLPAGILVVLLRAEVEKHPDLKPVEVGQQRRQRVPALERGYLFQLRLNGSEPFFLDCISVETRVVVIADLLFVDRASRPPGGCL